MIDQLALSGVSQRAKEVGITKVIDSAPEWLALALPDLVAFVRARRETTVEAWRYDWLTRCMPAPPSHKCYGALTTMAARRKFIENTRRYVPAQAERTHGHPVPVWKPGKKAAQCVKEMV